jgi:hypothetical protein
VLWVRLLSFWIALEEENNRWSCLARALRKADQEVFGKMNNMRENRGKDYNF